MSAKHTPGEWYASNDLSRSSGIGGWSVGPVGVEVAEIHGAPQAEADAKLIAAAPLMLDHHKRIEGEAKTLVDLYCKCKETEAACSACEILYLASEAVRKAEGDL